MADTDTQHLEKLRTYWKRNHAFPSMTKLCDVVGLSSTASVFDLVGRLKDAGYVQRVEGRIAPTNRFFARPFVGAVRAGLSQPCQDEDDFDVLTLDDYLVPDPNRTFLARVKGDSTQCAMRGSWTATWSWSRRAALRGLATSCLRASLKSLAWSSASAVRTGGNQPDHPPPKPQAVRPHQAS